MYIVDKVFYVDRKVVSIDSISYLIGRRCATKILVILPKALPSERASRETLKHLQNDKGTFAPSWAPDFTFIPIEIWILHLPYLGRQALQLPLIGGLDAFWGF